MKNKINKHDVVIEKYNTQIICDICKEEIEDEPFERADVTVESSQGSSYPDGGSGVNLEADVCVTCFNTKVKPLLEKTFDFKFHEYEYDY